jgi:SpoIVB peptidase S55
MPVSQIKAGMVGEAFTVFRGIKPEPFKVRVISVVRNFLPKQDVILVKAEDPRVEFSGIAAGMSGSPVYIDGKLIGAIAYAWAFAKEPLAGVTPIESMLAERNRPRRATRSLVEAGELVTAPAPVRGGDGSASGETGEPERAAAGGLTAADREPDGLRPVSVPLSISGISHRALGELGTALEPFGLVPVRAGGGGSGGNSTLPPADQRRISPGSAVGVQLIRGDMNATAVGTVSWVDGNSLIAFGHPMMGVGEVNLPLVTGEVHTFINSQANSFKLATPLVEVGTVVQDRPSCIVGDLGLRATMMPVTVRVTAPGAEPRMFRAEVARNKRLTPILASAVLNTAIADAEPDQTEMAVSLTTKMGVRDVGTIELSDQVPTSDGLSPRALAGLRGVRAMGDLMNNPFQPVGVDRLEFDVRIEYRKDFAEIISVALPSDEVRAGDTLPLRVTLRPYAGREYVETVPVQIPERLAGQSVRVEVASGSMVRPDVARPENLTGFIENLRSYYTASSIVVSLSLPEDGASLRGHLIPSLPPSALDTLRSASATRRADSYRVADRTVHPSQRLVTGRQELVVQVKEDSLGRNR